MDAPRDNLTRSVPFTVTRAEADGDGLTFEGYAAVWDSPTEINSAREGNFIERIKPGAFKRTLNAKMPVFMFDHGQHPMIGSMPLGVIKEAREDARGLFIQARFSDNWLISPVRDACAEGAIPGMSFRMSIPEGGETWRRAKGGQLAERDISEIKCYELGPVVFPAYEETSVGVRSREMLEQLADDAVRADLARALFMSTQERADTQPYGDTAYADPGYKDDKVKRYPINTQAHVKAAWSYINMERNQQGYTPEQVASIKNRIRAAAKKFGIEISDEQKSAEIDGDVRAWMMSDLCSIVEDAIEDQLYEDQMVCVVDVSNDGRAFYCVADDMGEMETYEVPFTIDDAGTVTLGTPAEVLKKTTYVPATSDETADGTSSNGRSKDADPASTATPQNDLDSADEVTPRGASETTDAETARFLRQLKARELGV